MKQFYIEEAKRISEAVNSAGGDFKFVAVADSHLDNSIGETLENISEVDKSVNFDCMVHLGDFLNGNIPYGYTEKIFKEQIESFSSAISGDFYPAQGNHDGFMDFVHNDMSTDELWTASTGLSKPNYYVDIPDKKIRLIVLCSFHYTMENGEFHKIYDLSPDTVEWAETEALNVGADWSVMLFSHDVPFSKFSDDCMSEETKPNNHAFLNLLISKQKEIGFDVPAWFIGHFHSDYAGTVCGINFILVASETAYVPQLWGPVKPGGYYPERVLESVSEDAWDAVVLDRENRELKLFRFGAGCDRSLKY